MINYTVLTNAELGSQNIHNLFLRGKSFEDLELGTLLATTMATLARPLVLLSQEQKAETDYSHEPQNEATSSRGVASNANFGNSTTHASTHDPTYLCCGFTAQSTQ